MSYRTWITYGYGVKIKDIDITNLTSDILSDFIHLAPEFETKYINWIKTNLREKGDPCCIYEILPIDNLLEYESEEQFSEEILSDEYLQSKYNFTMADRASIWSWLTIELRGVQSGIIYEDFVNEELA